MFLHLSVSHSVHRRRGCLPQFMLGYTPPGSRHSLWEQTPPQEQTNPRSSACLEIRATSGRYASYWNACLFLQLQIWMHSIFFNQCPAETFSPKEATVFSGSESHLVVAFGFLPQNFGKMVGTYKWYLSFYDCRLSGGDTRTLPTVIKTNWTFCIHRWWGHKNISLTPSSLLISACTRAI